MTLATMGILALIFMVVVTTVVAVRSPTTPGQTPRQSLVEAWANTGVGFAINYAANLTLLPLVGAQPSLPEVFWLGCLFTVVSVARQYAMRRWFNRFISTRKS